MRELKDLTAVEIGRLVNEREIRPAAVLDYFFERIKDYNPGLNAFTYIKKEEAYEAAAKLEGRIRSGQVVGPFAGVPFALKDFLPSKKGWTNTHGGVKCLEAQDAYDSEFCKAMEKAGGIAIGKTNAPAFGFRGTTDNKLYGPTRNPHSNEHNAGGSSGGSAAAVAAGLVPIAEGGDAGGSIRIPAAWCGCVGFKASAGLIPNVCRPDAWAATHPYCTPGGLTKNVRDARVLLDCMAKYDEKDPQSQFTHNIPIPSTTFARVGYTFDFGIFKDVDPEIKRALLRVVDFLRNYGGIIVEEVPRVVKRYTSDELANLWCRSISLDSAVEIELQRQKGFDLLNDHSEDLPEEFIYWQKKALESSVLDLYDIHVARSSVLDDIVRVFSEYDYLISPVTTCLPVKNTDNTLGPEGHERLIGFTETFLYNFTGNPAISIPIGYSSEGLPIGIQIAGPRYADKGVLELAQLIERKFN